ncbi:HupE/UreJ family protein [Tropicimonas sp.]|uniref:HupE/UreJ family protein n=1 Tax=Tropicimonas sp. TaxID=2067044 RepID=UPI003A8386D6
MNRILPGIALSLVAAPVMAHTGGGATTGLVHGLEHPILGADHLLAMLAVGLWSGFVLPSRVLSGAAVFLSAMVAGGGLAAARVPVPGVEAMILASVLVFGALVLVSREKQRWQLTVLSLATIGFFAASHGYAHVSEATGMVAAYFAGFVISTAALHLAGICLARLVAGREPLQRAIGGTVIASGLALIVG